MSEKKVRKRTHPKMFMGKVFIKRWRNRISDGAYLGPVGAQLNDVPFSSSGGFQYTESEGHPWRTRPRPPGDLGGEFYTKHQRNATTRVARTSWSVVSKDVNLGRIETAQYKLPLYACNPDAQPYAPYAESSNSALLAKGTTAIAQSSPTNPVANFGTALGELMKDRLPSIPFLKDLERRASLAFKAGDEFLNVVFGWEPLVADIKDTAKALTHARTVIKQFERDAGKQVRRRFVFPTEYSVETIQVASYAEPWYGPTSSGPASTSIGGGPLMRTRETTKEIWFSGAFTYHMPKGYFSLGAGDVQGKLDKLLGLDLTPSLVWELAPWSWAVDWVTNIGDGISNLSAWTQFGQVLRYGYIMETTSVRDTYTLTPSGGDKSSIAVVAPVVLESIVKKRLKANPYGFGVTWEGLNPIQLAILGALGITKH